MDVGVLKAQNFKNSQNKLAYAYVLTPKGIEDKAEVTTRFLHRKLKEYAEIEREIEHIREELSLNRSEA